MVRPIKKTMTVMDTKVSLTVVKVSASKEDEGGEDGDDDSKKDGDDDGDDHVGDDANDDSDNIGESGGKGDGDNDCDSEKVDKTDRGKRVIGKTVITSAKTVCAKSSKPVRGKKVSSKIVSAKTISVTLANNKKDVAKKGFGKKKVATPAKDMSTPFLGGLSDRTLLLSIKDHVLAAIWRNEVTLYFQCSIIFMS
ncbi:hypothetical protein Sjap_005266 [Stephania japonica]|uniref:Uncharacterized protein n=1 Tax=Stephania japonica TaxID=461633 RepID=A0AAP0K3Q8_9MAGN